MLSVGTTKAERSGKPGMPKSQPGAKSELIAGIERAWDELQAFLERLTEEQLQAVQDPVGWTSKDHLTHLSSWEDSIAAPHPEMGGASSR